jgi:hypothetical protein
VAVEEEEEEEEEEDKCREKRVTGNYREGKTKFSTSFSW